MASKKKPKKVLNQLSNLSAEFPGALPESRHIMGQGDNDASPGEDIKDEPTEVEMDDLSDEADVKENDDGSADIYLEDGAKDETMSKDFDANLADHLPEHVLDELAMKYMQLIEDAIEARKKRDDQYDEGLKRAGLGGPAPGGAEFEGASRVTHPVLAEAYVDFSASAMKELFPPSGPVRTQVIGEQTEKKLGKARRKCDYMNWQLTKEVPEYRSELEILLTQLPAGGSQFLKLYWSTALGRVVVDFVGVDEFILPYNARGFKRAPFFFHRMTKNEFDMNTDIANELYRDVSMVVPDGFAEESKTATTSHKIEGKDYNFGANDSGEYVVFEGTCYEDSFDDPKRPEDRQCPYIITIDEGSNKILSIYRNWEEKDDKCEDIPYMVEFKFIPWRGAYGIGLPHLIGDLSAALTGTLRALLDSAHIQNAATGLKLKGKPGGETVSASPTQVSEIDAMAGDDIRKIFMPLSFNGPSPVLLQLLGFLQSAAKGVVSTSEEKIADAGNQMPVGTAMALIEQGAKVYSSIHARMHHSQEEALTIVHRLNFRHMKKKVRFGEDDNDFVTQDDFKGPLDIYPVSDPSIFSETQRYAQMQAIMQMAEKNPPAWKMNILYERMLKLMKVPDYKELLSQPPKPKPNNPASENVMMAMGSPTAAFPEQDHLAHIQVHLDFLKSPIFGMSQMGLKMIPSMIEHLKQHMLFYYADCMRLEGKHHAGEDISKMVADDKSWQTDRDVSEALAEASPVAMKAAESAFQGASPIIQQAMEFMQKNQPKPPADPNVELGHMELQQRATEHKDEMGLEGQRLHQAMQKMMGDQENKMKALSATMTKAVQQMEAAFRNAQLESQTELQTTGMQVQGSLHKESMAGQTKIEATEDNNETALEIAEQRASSMSDGGSMTH